MPDAHDSENVLLLLLVGFLALPGATSVIIPQGGVKMSEERAEKLAEGTEARCDVCRKTFPPSEAGKRCPECGIGRIWVMEKAA